MKERKPNVLILLLTLLLAVPSGTVLAATGPVVITQHPASQTVLEGTPATFSVEADGSPELLYQWLRNGSSIAETGPTLTLPAVTAADDGVEYAVDVSNEFGTVRSTAAVLTVDPGTLVTNVQTLLVITNMWKYDQSGIDRGTAWRAPAYDDSAWPEGRAALYVEPSPLPEPAVKSTPLTLGRPTYYFRTPFQFSHEGAVSVRLMATTLIDDGAAFYLNGTDVLRLRVNPNAPYSEFATALAAGGGDAIFEGPFEFPSHLLMEGENVMAVEVKQFNATSSDIVFAMTLEAEIVTRIPDTQPPVIASTIPPAGATVRSLEEIELFFSERVSGVEASDLLINGVPATVLHPFGDSQFVFEFPEPATGTVQIAWAPNHGIQDLAVTPNPFGGAGWSYTLDPNADPPSVLISEFMASNNRFLRDEDGDYSDWIELYNASNFAINLAGWTLTDDANDLAMWRFPNVTMLPQTFLLVFASGKDKTEPAGRLHTNFRLDAAGEYLGLVDPSGNVISEFAPTYPPQTEDVSYGRDLVIPESTGYFSTPTPGEMNSTKGEGFAPEIVFSPSSRTFFSAFPLELSTPDHPGAEIRYVIVNNATTASTVTVPTSSSTLYTGPIQITSTMQVRARAFLPGHLPGPVRTESFIQLNQNLAAFSSDIPLVLMHNFGAGEFPGSGVISTRTVAVMIFDTINGRSSLTNEPHVSTISRVNLRGSSTQGFPKRSYRVEFWNELYQDRKLEVLGMPIESDWVMYAPNQFDIPLIHNQFIYQLSNDAGQYATRTRTVETFVNTAGGVVNGPAPGGNYNGVYVLIEKIKRDPNRVALPRLEPEHTSPPEITGGYMMKIDRVGSNERTFSGGGKTMVYEYPDGRLMVPPLATPQRLAQAQYISSFFNSMNSSLSGNNYPNFINVENWIDQHLLNVLPMNLDALRLSAFKYKTRDELDRHGNVVVPGRVHFGPIWDFDRSMGTQRGDSRPYNPRSWLAIGGDGGTDFFNAATRAGFANTWYGALFLKPDFFQQWIDRYQELREGVFSTSHMFALVDALADEVREAQVREVARWGGNGASDTRPRSGVVSANGYSYNFPGTYQGEIDFMKQWLSDRVHFMDTNFVARPSMSHEGGEVSPGFTLSLSGPPGATVYYTLDGTDPRAPGGNIAANATAYSGPIVISSNARVVARARNPNHRNLTGAANLPLVSVWSGPRAATFMTEAPQLRITEIMYHPLPPAEGSGVTDDDFEFIEVKNIGSQPLNLNGFRIGGGVDFTFTNMVLQPGAHAVVVSHLPSFQARYGMDIPVAGTYRRVLSNSDERLTLHGPLQEPILNFRYRDDWHKITDGFGFSLVIADDTAPRSSWGEASAWRVGSVFHGSPGQDDPPVSFPRVVVNEVVANTATGGDALELHNLSETPADISGWFLTDALRTPKKYEIPAGTIIPPGGYRAFTEEDFNAPELPNRFAFGARGEEVYLFSGAAGELTGYFHGFEFDASDRDVSFGRYVISTGEEHYPAQITATFGSANSGPLVGPVVISEIMYHPSAGRDQFVELKNITGQAVPLYDTAAPSNTWRLSGVGFDFPQNASIPANGHALVVGMDPAEFRAKYGVNESVAVFGPFSGTLQRGGELLRLRKPGNAGGGSVPYIVVDAVDYSRRAPWPVAADGIGPSLQRLDPAAYGNDPINWVAAGASPGADYPGGTGPSIATPPQDQTVVAYFDASFSVEAGGPGPFSYQWRFNGTSIDGATNAVLELENVQPSQDGEYVVVVINPASAISSPPARLTVLIPAEIVEQPRSQSVRPGTNVTFNVNASSSTAMRYQWLINGTPIPGATNSSYTVVGPVPDGDTYSWDYSVVIHDDVGPIYSQPARLTVLVNPFFIEWPLSQTVVAGQPVTFFTHMGGTPPFSYRWRRGSSQLNWFDSGESIYTIPIAQMSDAGNYTVIVINPANESPGVINNIPALGILPASLTVLADSDGDGLPDDWETLHGLDPNNPNDALLDNDGDGMTNLEEWIAGTDPNDPESYLRVENLALLDLDTTVIEFQAGSNRTYSVQFTDSLVTGEWMRLTNIAQAADNRLITITNNAGSVSGQHYFRLVAPAQP
jgi:hypothetical protein